MNVINTAKRKVSFNENGLIIIVYGNIPRNQAKMSHERMSLFNEFEHLVEVTYFFIREFIMQIGMFIKDSSVIENAAIFESAVTVDTAVNTSLTAVVGTGIAGTDFERSCIDFYLIARKERNDTKRIYRTGVQIGE